MKTNYRILIFFLTITISTACKTALKNERKFSNEMNIVSDWFDAWELVFEDIYELDNYESADFIFFDGSYIYSTSSMSIPDGTNIDGPDIFDEKLNWKKKNHNGNITLPTGENVPVGLMVFASLSNEKRPYFIMPLPEIWESVEIKADIDLNLFLTGIFLHEFSHTQQMKGIGAEITAKSKGTSFEEDLSDEIVQQIFKNDITFVSAFEKCHSKIYEVASKQNTTEKITDIESILNAINKRQEDFFIGEYEELKQLNPLFLTMEGVGQYTMYAWLSHPEGGNLELAEAMSATRTKSWIQDEGFGLALLLAEFENPKKWSNKVFGQNSITILELLKYAIEK